MSRILSNLESQVFSRFMRVCSQHLSEIGDQA